VADIETVYDQERGFSTLFATAHPLFRTLDDGQASRR
jgi:hypothetical protein